MFILAKSYLKWRAHQYVFEGAEVLYDPDDDDDDDEEDDDEDDSSDDEEETSFNSENSGGAGAKEPATATEKSLTEASPPVAEINDGKPSNDTVPTLIKNSQLTATDKP